MLKTFLILFAFGSLILSESATLTEDEKAELLEDPAKIDRLIKETNAKIKETKAALLNVNREIKENTELLYDKAAMLSFVLETVNYAPYNKQINYWEMAKYISNEFRKTFKPRNWHCIVGRQIAYDLNNNTKPHIFTSVGNMDILLFN